MQRGKGRLSTRRFSSVKEKWSARGSLSMSARLNGKEKSVRLNDRLSWRPTGRLSVSESCRGRPNWSAKSRSKKRRS